MMNPSVVLCLISLSVVLQRSGVSHAAPFSFNMSTEGSGYMDDLQLLLTNSSVITYDPAGSVAPTAKGAETDSARLENLLLGQVVDFLEENLFLVLLVSSLLVVVFLIVCCAAVMSRKRKVSAYYPCSFPAKMYVDQRDMSGGARLFNEVPEKPPNGREGEPADSARRLREDIKMAAKSLRTPAKAPRGERVGKDAKPKFDGVEKRPQVKEVVAENKELPEQVNVSEPVNSEPKGSVGPKQSLDSMPNVSVCLMEKSDPREEDPLKDNELPAGPENSEVQQEMVDKQEVVTPAIQFISGEKTAF